MIEHVEFDYLEYEEIIKEASSPPTLITIAIKFNNLGVEELHALSDDERVSKIYISHMVYLIPEWKIVTDWAIC